MAWLVLVACVVLLVVVLRKSVDRETARNFKRLGTVLLAAFALLILIVVVEAITHGSHS